MILWLGTVIKESVEEIVEQGKEAEGVSKILAIQTLILLTNFVEWLVSANIRLKIYHFSGHGGKHCCGRLQHRLAQINRRI